MYIQLKHVMIKRQTDTNGIPAVHSNCFINKSNSISGIITTTHIRPSASTKEMILKINLILLPAIKSDAV